jgi:lysophospholipase L1-like esterase
MPIGDSITYGVSQPIIFSGYRDLLYALLDDVDYTVDFVGTQIDTHNANIPDPHHQSHRGFRIDQISAGLNEWLGRIDDPDVVLLMVGTNDFLQNYQTAQASNRLNALITDIASARPFAKIIVASIVPNTSNPAVEAAQLSFNATIPTIVGNQVSLGRDIHFVDMHAALTNADISSDGIHPTEAGYDKMANAWFDAITPIISPDGDNEAPAIARVLPVSPNRLDVVFSKPIQDASANPSHFSLDAGVGISAATLDAGSKRVITLTTSPLVPETVRTLSVTGVRDRTPANLLIAPGSTATFASPYVANGGFEFDFVGWNVTGSAQIVADVERYYKEGRRTVVFNGGNGSPNGILSQSLATEPGQTYHLRLSVGVLAFNTAQQRLQCALVGAGPLVTETVSIEGQGSGKVTWVSREFLFVADSATTTLTLRDTSTSTQSIDLLLDDVRIERVIPRSLSVQSSPESGVTIAVSPSDNDGAGAGNTPFSREYSNGSSVTLTAPALASGRTFQKWVRNGADYDTSPSTSILLDADHTLLAVYVDDAPSISAAPLDLTATVGTTATFSVSASGTAPLGYQWRRDGADITGANASVYTIPNVAAGHAGLYDVIVSNTAGPLTSNAAELIVISSGHLANGSFENGLTAWSATGNLIAYTGTNPVPAHGGSFVIFNGSNLTPNGILMQRFTTTPGHIYTLAFSMGVYSWNTQQQRLHVDVTGNTGLASQTFTLAGLSGGSTRWASREVSFVADSTTTTLSFSDVSTTSSSLDLLLDNVALVSSGPPTYTLSVNSTPWSNIDISVTPLDENDEGDGSTEFSRSYAMGTSVTLTAPATANGSVFLRWDLNGSAYSNDAEITLEMDANHTLSAVYESPLLLENGSFESDFASWAASGNIAIATGGPYVGTNGARMVAFNGGNSTPNGVLEQTFVTVPGQDYVIEFDYGVRAFNKDTVRLRAIATGNETLVSHLFSIAGIGGGNLRWAARSLLFTADSSLTTLTFEDASTVTNNLDLLLDNVRVNPN